MKLTIGTRLVWYSGYIGAVLFGLILGGCSGQKHQKSGAGFSDLTGDAPTAAAPKLQAVTNDVDQALFRHTDDLFTLGPGDRIELELIGNSASRTDTFVGPDGKVYFNLLPGQDVWGLTLSQTRELMERELAKYLNAPQVVVTLREVASRHVWLLGRVNRPGIYPMPGPMSLLEAIATAGGTAHSASQVTTEELADLRHSFVMRQGKHLPVDFYRLLKDGDTTQNVYLQPNDFVFLPSTLSQEIYVLGAVKSPRAVPYQEPMTVSSAIAGADGPVFYELLTPSTGGRVTDAYLSHVAVVRGSLATPEIAIVDYRAILHSGAPDIRLEPGDIVYVPNSPYGTLKSYVNMVIGVFVTTIAANEGAHAGGSTNNVGISISAGGTSSGGGGGGGTK